MRTPGDAFHTALLNLLEQKRRVEAARLPKRHMAAARVGERVVFMPARPHTPALVTNQRGSHGVITDVGSGGMVYFRADGAPESATYCSHIAHFEMENPPPTDIDGIEKWLTS